MNQTRQQWLRDLANLVARTAKAAPSALTGSQWSGTGFIDSYKRNRSPTPNELMAELKGTAWSCASINAAVCAAYPPSLFVGTSKSQAAPRCATAPLTPLVERSLRERYRLKAAVEVSQVTDHVLIDLLETVNPIHNAFDLWELTTLYQEVHGAAYWNLKLGPLGVPVAIWPLPSQNMTPMREPDSRQIVDYYQYRTGAKTQDFDPATIIHFRYPDPRDPYTGGLSPLRAVYEQAALTSEYAAFKRAKFENRAIPDALIAPDEVIGEEERDRLETQWNQKLRRGGAGKVIVAESKYSVQMLSQSMGDLAQLAEIGATKEDICNGFHVPMSYLSKETNLANLQASENQHMSLAISPRLERRDEKLNERLVPFFDPSKRLFLASEDPIPANRDILLQELTMKLRYGYYSINQARAIDGLAPVPWGDVPWLPMIWARTDYTGRADNQPPNTGRNRKPKPPEDSQS